MKKREWVKTRPAGIGSGDSEHVAAELGNGYEKRGDKRVKRL